MAETPQPAERIDVEQIMREVRARAAATAGRRPQTAEVRFQIGVADPELARQVEADVRERAGRREVLPPSPHRGTIADPIPLAASSSPAAAPAPGGRINRLLRSARQWLYRASRIQFHLDVLNERIGAVGARAAAAAQQASALEQQVAGLGEQTAKASRRLDEVAVSTAGLGEEAAGMSRQIAAIAERIAALERRQSLIARELDPLSHELRQWIIARRGDVAEEPGPDQEQADRFTKDLQEAFRGKTDVVEALMARHLPRIQEVVVRADARARVDLLDLGCGRGELLAHAGRAGLRAVGVDSSAEMIRVCRDRRLEVVQADLREYLEAQPDGSAKVISFIHGLEHIPPRQVMGVLCQMHRVLAPAGRLILEFPNVFNVLTASNYFYIDPTHDRPVHPYTVELLLKSIGFAAVGVVPENPADERLRLPALSHDVPGAEQVNRIVDRLNELLYGPQDAVVVADKSGRNSSQAVNHE